MSDASSFDDDHTPNPYGPTASVARAYAEGEIRLPDGQSRGMVGQIPVVGILMIIQGGILMVASLAIAAYAVLMPRVFEEMQRDAAAGGGNAPPMPADFGSWIIIIGGIFALAIGAIGLLTIVSGWKVIKCRGRTLAIVMLCAGMISITTCYCFPTALALAIYGLIVLLNAPVKLAFELGERGYDPREIQRAFAMLP